MNIQQVLRELDLEIGRLQQARAILNGPEESIAGKRVQTTKTEVSDAARSNRSAGQKLRWIKRKQAAKREVRQAARALVAKTAVPKAIAKPGSPKKTATTRRDSKKVFAPRASLKTTSGKKGIVEKRSPKEIATPVPSPRKSQAAQPVAAVLPKQAAAAVPDLPVS